MWRRERLTIATYHQMLHGAAIDETQPGKGSVGGNLARQAGQRQRHNVDHLLNNACTLNYFLKIMHLNKQKQTKKQEALKKDDE